MIKFLRGEPVIICDADAPSAGMIALITGWDADVGVWRARYLNPKTHLIHCFSDRPTRVADFGMTVEIDVANGEYRVVPDGKCVATYDDGQPRKWQDYGASAGGWHKARAPAFRLLQAWMAREMERIGA